MNDVVGGPALRDLYAKEALPALPKILQLLDRNPLSPTYGSFDRSYWHFRTMDFPSGMSQEFVLPLALVFRHQFPENPYFDKERIRDWVVAGIDFARRSSHADGSCDDYYPFERALGAAVFSLYAMAEACCLLDIKDGSLKEFLAHRATWVMTHGESGILSNHHAIAALALATTARVTGDHRFDDGAKRKAQEVLAHQSEEGWHQEYDGFDPGYETVTIDFLARYLVLTQDESVRGSLERAVALMERVQHPDGTFGGEYSSRNTYHLQPHGFELLGKSNPQARRIADRLLHGLSLGRRAINDDDRLLGHHVYPYLFAWLDFAPRSEPTPLSPPPERIDLPHSGIFVDRRPGAFLIAGLRKGAPFRIYRSTAITANDSGLAVRLVDGRVLVSHLTHDAEVARDGTSFVVRGHLRPAKIERMTPMKTVVLRLVMLTIGRFFRDFVRKRLQKRLILGGDESPFRFERRLSPTEHGWEVEDVLIKSPSAPKIASIHLGVGQTSIYIAVSQPWHPAWLLPWTDLSRLIPELEAKGRISIARNF